MTGIDPDAQAAFAALFDQYQPAVFGYLLGRLSDREHARDLTQETFVRLWQRLAEVRELPEGRRGAWIFTVARNLTTDAYRARSTRDATQRALHEQVCTVAPAQDEPYARAVTRERVREVASAVRALPEELRVVLSMHAVGELTSAQIGAMLDQPAGTVRYRLSLARRRLAEALGVSTTLEV